MLNEYNFKSIFKDELNYFVKYKRSLGLKYEREIFRLRYIDNILYNLNFKSKKITKETFYKLIERNNMQGENYARQYGVTKDFCKFLILNEYKTQDFTVSLTISMDTAFDLESFVPLLFESYYTLGYQKLEINIWF